MRAPLVALRHAPVLAEGLCYGRADVPLAIDLEESLRLVQPPRADCVWSSTTARCSSLAEAIASDLGVEVRIDERLCELDFGDWEGVAWNDIEPEALERWMRDWKRESPPNGEQLADLEQRVLAWESSLDRTQTHLLVGHAGVIRALWVMRLGLSWEQAMERAVPHLTTLDLTASE